MAFSRMILAALVSAFVITANAVAGPECDCYKLGHQAFKATSGCQGRPAYCGAGSGQPFEGGCLDARYGGTRHLDAGDWCGAGGGGASQGVPGAWYALGNMPSVGGACPPSYPIAYNGRCYQTCQVGAYPFLTPRGDVCVQCPNGKPRTVNLTGDGRLFCIY